MSKRENIYSKIFKRSDLFSTLKSPTIAVGILILIRSSTLKTFLSNNILDIESPLHSNHNIKLKTC